ncbi:MAG: formylglycine-generating enzyme family protein [Thermotogaceae bacterium]|nr:formylglycine-generating enzyme family protein [Thermotogaceae bacterium]
MRGTIKDDFIVFRLLSGSELGVSPGKIKSIVFLKKEEPVIIGEDPNQEDTPNPNASEAPVNQSLIDSASLPENMVLVERGSFTMGDVPRRGGTDSEDAHNVVLTYDFYIGKCEVTFDEYDAFCDATGSGKPSADGMGSGRKPVIMVSWWNAIAYCNWLSENDKIPKAYDNDGNLLDKYGKVTTDPSKAVGYRLPTEAEWEYAAEGGPNNDRYSLYGSDNADEVAWHSDNCGGETQVVGAKKSNSLGLFDMSGNVWEWCSDSFSKSMNSIRTNPYCIDFYKVLRGGSCFDSAWFLWIGDSETSNPFETYNDVGFRICRTATN